MIERTVELDMCSLVQPDPHVSNHEIRRFSPVVSVIEKDSIASRNSTSSRSLVIVEALNIKFTQLQWSRFEPQDTVGVCAQCSRATSITGPVYTCLARST